VLPFGSLDLQSDPHGFLYGGYHLNQFVSLSDVKVRGLRNTYRHAGIGAAIVGPVEPTQQNAANRWIPPNAKTAVTAIMRFDGARTAMSSGKVRGALTIYDDSEVSTVRIGAYSVPLESDPSAALAYRLQNSPLWDFEIAGFRGQDFSFLGAGQSDTGGLYMLHPYRPGLIPVVFVHGTASAISLSRRITNSGFSSTIAAIRLRYLPCACAKRCRPCAGVSIPTAATLRWIKWS
jgi:hypothetical protein